MEAYRTEEEQLEALKKWWKENGTAILVGVSVALAGVFGYKGWQNHKLSVAAEASAIYSDLLEVSSKSAQGELSEEDKSSLEHLANQLKTEFSDTTYAVFAAFVKAKQAVAEKDLAAAKTELEWVLKQDIDVNLKLVAKLRLARVTFAESTDQAGQALALVENVDAGKFTANYESFKGDVYLAQGNQAKAREAYQKALDASKDSGQPNPFVQVKLDDLAAQ
ncbi:tetratricopeptide repeat protein [Endozoicomonas sp. SM1973]|uniref:Ancillary SecYEG translocon subunit n=1 Tax=Spartinivicinus marinus TaxID=2994442 RepID=A0A853I6M3_9GAMM|nr:tetratricopeptide repeat protein [Spartinivicinus marinus]NYZ65217.1 tetratricopeptide repeat protein [Spartinivicinus marinus]